MHEIGHNLGLGHSNEPGQSYGDQSSMMGYSYDIDDGPKMCFNAAKNYQLGWYERQKGSFFPLSNKNKVVDFVLNGVSEYKTSGNTEGKLVTLRIGDGGTSDYYVGFNDAYGANSGTIEGRNQVLIFYKATGGPDNYGESDRVAALGVGRSYTIANFGGEEFDVTIELKSITNGGRDANIEISTVGNGPLVTPTERPTSVPVTKRPVPEPTLKPTVKPKPPTREPTKAPVPAPTDEPTVFDDVDVESNPTATPTAAPTIKCPPDTKKVVFQKKNKKNNKIRK